MSNRRFILVILVRRSELDSIEIHGIDLKGELGWNPYLMDLLDLLSHPKLLIVIHRYVRKLTKTYKNVYVCTGPLYLPRKETDGKLYVKYEVIGTNNVAVPTHFFKVVVCETKDGQLEMESYVMPNDKISDDTPLESFRVPPESVERAAGLLFFDKINRKMLNKINGKKV